MTRIVGTPQKRNDGFEKVTGAARFIADLNLGRVLYARVVRSDYGHARILRLDVTQALLVKGVRAVVTGADCPKRVGHALADMYPIARDTVRYWGEPVAVVVATSQEIAEQAAGLVRVEYEALPVILHPRDSVQAGAPLIHPDLEEYEHVPGVHSVPGTNIAHRYQLNRGDVDAAFAGAHLVVENEYWVPWIAHVQMEPHGAVAKWDGDRLQIWTSTQSPFFVRETISHLLDLPSAKVRVQVPFVGGGFGGKSDVTIEPLMALVARSVPGLAIQLILTREEVFSSTLVGRGGWGRARHAVDAEGRLLAQEVELYIGAGGYADTAVWVSQGGGHNSTGPYYVPSLRLRSHAVYTNTPPTGAYRGYGHPEAHWMVERQMDQIARRLGMDPGELRRKNLLRPGMENALGQVMKLSNGQPELCLDAVREALSRPVDRPASPRLVRGKGLACFMKSPVMRTNAQSGAILRFNDDGSASLYTGAIEMGQGMSTTMAQIAAETLDMPLEAVHYVQDVDTEFSPYEWQTVASHTTWAVGNAVKRAAEDARAQIIQAAAQVFEVPPEAIEAVDGRVFPKGQDWCALPYARLTTGYTRLDGSALNPPVVGRGTFVPTGLVSPDPVTGQGNVAASWTFGCQGAEVEVDLDTGQVRVLRLISAQDPGRVINPEQAAGQVEGAMVMALGAALMEKLKFAPDGSLRNRSFVDYRILTSVDIPELEVIFVQTHDATGPYGARGLGEHGITAVPPAIANAISNALGIDFYEIPITPDVVYEAIQTAEEKERTRRWTENNK